MGSLTIDLFDPGMGPLHRAGLGGLAATIRGLKGSPDLGLGAGLDYDVRQVRLSWGAPEDASELLRRLYGWAFRVVDGLIYLPGCYGTSPPRVEVRAELQEGMARTILQFGPNRKSEGPSVIRSYSVDDATITIRHQNLTRYTHCSAWEDLVTSRGVLKPSVQISGTIAPGFVQRHVAFPITMIDQPPGSAIALHFALVGTLSLAVGAKAGALLIPDVEDLKSFAERREFLTPRDARECRVAGAADAALQAHLRLRGTRASQAAGLRRSLAILFSTQDWNKKQKSRASVLEVVPGDETLARFDVAIKELPPRVIVAGADKATGAAPGAFWVDSVIRPLIAENLAGRRPWFHGFRGLVVGPDGSTDDDRVRQLGYERGGLTAMIDEPWEDRGEERLVRAVHDAMGWRFQAIKKDTRYEPTTGANKGAYLNRRDRQMQRWRLAFAGAKTADDVRDALADLWSRSAPNAVLRRDESWRDLLPILCDERRWRLNRDLALLALASYGRSKAAVPTDAARNPSGPVEVDDGD